MGVGVGVLEPELALLVDVLLPLVLLVLVEVGVKLLTLLLGDGVTTGSDFVPTAIFVGNIAFVGVFGNGGCELTGFVGAVLTTGAGLALVDIFFAG